MQRASRSVNHAMGLGLTVGLGTDVAGGISPSMLTAIRMAVINSRCLRAHKLALKVGWWNGGARPGRLGYYQQQQQGFAWAPFVQDLGPSYMMVACQLASCY
jgi:hypothetical protein